MGVLSAVPRRAGLALAAAVVVAVATGCPVRPPTTAPPPVPPPGPCDRAAMRCPRDVTPALRALGLGHARAQAVSATGEIVGSGRVGPVAGPGLLSTVGFRLPAEGTARLVPGPGNGVVSLAAVNAQGLVAGFEAVTDRRAVVWNAQDRPTDLTPKLPTFGGTLVDSTAHDVNEHGQVAGSYLLEYPTPDPETAARAPMVFVWDARTDAVSVVNPESALDPDVYAVMPGHVGIDGQGAVVSSLSPEAGTPEQLVQWVPQPDGRYRRQVLGSGTAIAVSASGAVLGMADATVPGTASRPALWRAGSAGPAFLPPPAGWTPGSPYTYTATDINARGEVVGSFAGRPIRWPSLALTPPELLQTDSRTRISGDVIGDDGTIVGTWLPAEPTSNPLDAINAERRNLVWDPVP